MTAASRALERVHKRVPQRGTGNEPRAGAVAEPSSRIVHAALRKTTERLAHELSCPGDVVPDWSELEWRMARAAAAIHGVSPLLCAALRWTGPASWERFLHEQRAHTLRRHQELTQSLARLDVRLRAAGIAAVALKGATLHRMGLYAPGERPMADLDMLVREPDLEPAVCVIEALGLTESLRSWRERTFTARSQAPATSLGEHSGRGLKIELHVRICEKLPWRITDITDLVFPADLRPGIQGYASHAALMSHLLLHAAGAVASRTLRLVHLHDLALLAARMAPEAWTEVTAVHADQGGPWWALPPLALTARYYPQAIPPRVLAELTPRCHGLLRHICRSQSLSDVSLSRVWVDAFPGIEWARSAREMLAYVGSRLRPAPDALAYRQDTARTADWAGGSAWYRLSQHQRLLRFITSRPTRPSSMHAVRTALTHPR